MSVADDYRVLLADGIVGYTGAQNESLLMQWTSELLALAEADGVQAGLFFMHSPMVEHVGLDDVPPFVRLLHGDDHGSNIYPYDQRAAAAWHRPRAEAEWGDTLERARSRQASF